MTDYPDKMDGAAGPDWDREMRLGRGREHRAQGGERQEGKPAERALSESGRGLICIHILGLNVPPG